MTCATCKFYEMNPQNMATGNCTRFPPVVIAMGNQGVSCFPGVQAKMNCGEHMPRIIVNGNSKPIAEGNQNG